MRTFLTSGSASVNGAGSALLTASPVYLTGVGLAAPVTGSAMATWYAGSTLAGGSALWTLAVAACGYVGETFPAPVLSRGGLIVNVLSGCANTTWGL